MMAARLLALLALLSFGGLNGCKSNATGSEAAAGVIVPCPGTSDPIPGGLQCGLVCRAAFPIRGSLSQLFLVDIQVDGKPILMLVDTGADRTLLSPLAAARIGLPPATPELEKIPAVGGVLQVGSTTMHSMVLGNVHIGPGRIYVLPRTQAVAGTGDLGYDGILGDDILSLYHVDLDFRHQMMRLYEGKLCPGPLPGWSAEVSVVPFTTKPGSNFVGVTATLNGLPINALLDTGAETIAAGGAVARQLNVGSHELAQDAQAPILGAGPDVVVGRVHRFRTLGLGAMTVPEPVVAIIPDNSKHPWMIIGDPVLATRRVWIDYAGRQVHFGQPD